MKLCCVYCGWRAVHMILGVPVCAGHWPLVKLDPKYAELRRG